MEEKADYMKIFLNGEEKQALSSIKISDLVLQYDTNRQKSVIEYNGRILNQEEWEKITISENDKIEIISFMGGGR